MRKLLTLSLFAVLACAQTAKYPSSIVTDGDLGVASNLANTTLAAGITPSATSFTVRSAAGIAANVFLTLSNAEIVKVCGVTGTTIQVGDSSCPNIDGRGFDGTTATYHSSGGAVRSYPISKNHNQLAAEVKAIQNTLGVNLSNVPGFNAPYRLATTYNFTPQSPGGSLIAGANSITMTPVPAGVNGSDADHYLYVSGGVGAAEACLIIGGSGVAGDASGQIIIQCAGPHSGAWTVGPAAGGIQEAICALPAAGGEVVVSHNVTLYANVGKCGKTQPSVRKMAGASVSGAFTVLEQAADPSVIEWSTGPQAISALLGMDNYRVSGFSVFPEGHDPWPPSYGAGLSVQQADPTKLDMNNFFHGIAVDVRTSNPGPTNENAAVLGFMTSYGGARPWGGDFHSIVPAAATAVPGIQVGVQAETETEKVGVTEKYPLLAVHRSTIGQRATSMLTLWSDATSGADFLINTNENVFKHEGIVLRLADSTNPLYRAFAVVNSTNTANNWYAAKNGYMFSRGGVSDIIHTDGSTVAGWRIYRVGEPGAADQETLIIGSDVNTPNAFEITTGKAGTGSTRPLIFSIDGTERMRMDGTAGVQIGTARFRSGAGSPEGAVTGNIGDIWLRTDGGAGTVLYVKESVGGGATGWVAK
jgi:hypothetical protein